MGGKLRLFLKKNNLTLFSIRIVRVTHIGPGQSRVSIRDTQNKEHLVKYDTADSLDQDIQQLKLFNIPLVRE